jgi:hypothetical protein
MRSSVDVLRQKSDKCKEKLPGLAMGPTPLDDQEVEIRRYRVMEEDTVRE